MTSQKIFIATLLAPIVIMFIFMFWTSEKESFKKQLLDLLYKPDVTHLDNAAKKLKSSKLEQAEKKDFRGSQDAEGDNPSFQNTKGDNFQFQHAKDDTLRHRFPQAVVIGFGKCGTMSLLNALSIHPYVVTYPGEVKFYDDNFDKGYEWYRKLMPLSYSNQITLEKSPGYIRTPRAMSEMSHHFPNVKLIVLVRDPVQRLLSDFAMAKRKDKHSLTYSESKVKDLKSYFKTKRNTPLYRRLNVGIYAKHLSLWMSSFNRNQIHVIHGEELVARPLAVLKEVEKFLQLPRMYSGYNFVKNETRGFYCYRGFAPHDQTKCLSPGKGRPHENISQEELRKLYDFYRPYNEELYKLLGRRFQWTLKSQLL